MNPQDFTPEPTKPTEPVRPPTSVPVMTDIRPASTAPLPATPAQSDSSSSPDPAPGGLRPDLTQQAQSETPVTPGGDSTTPTSPVADTHPDHSGQPLLAAHGSARRVPVAVIALAVTMFVVLAGVAVYAYLQSQDDSDSKLQAPATTRTDQSGAADEPGPATSQEVQTLADELDAAADARAESEEIPTTDYDPQSIGL